MNHLGSGWALQLQQLPREERERAGGHRSQEGGQRVQSRDQSVWCTDPGPPHSRNTQSPGGTSPLDTQVLGFLALKMRG